MTCAAVVLRPEPGNARTAARLAALGIAPIRQPLFAIVPVTWVAPDPACFDALLLTSANAVRHAGSDMETLAHLPVVAVGEATAEAARRAGLHVALTGAGNVADLLYAARGAGVHRPLHLAGQDRVLAETVPAITVYASEALPLAPGAAAAWRGQLVLLHSVRAARRFVALVERDAVDRVCIRLAAISPAVLAAAGRGWEIAEAAAQPRDAVLVALAAALIDRPVAAADKRPR